MKIISSLLLLLLLIALSQSIPTCIIIDTNDTSLFDENPPAPSIHLRHFPLADLAPASSSTSESSTEPPMLNRTFSSCTLQSLDDLEETMALPFEFRRLHIEQADHRTKYLNYQLYESLAEGSMAVYEHRSNPDGVRYCRTCHDGLWQPLTICQVIRCDAELLRANPRLVTEWGEVQPLDGGALYAPSSVIAVYTFALQPHCKRCEPNGKWSDYALMEYCADIKLFRPTPTSTV